LLQHAFAVLHACLSLARLLGLRARGLHLVAPLFASLGILGLRAIEAGSVGLRRLCMQSRTRSDERCSNNGEQSFQPSCLSMVPASETSNLPGPSTLTCFTTPLSTSIEKRFMRVPMPRAFKSSSRPSALAQAALPSARKRILPSAFWSRPQCAMTNASLVATHQIWLTPFFFSW